MASNHAHHEMSLEAISPPHPKRYETFRPMYTVSTGDACRISRTTVQS